MENVNIIIVEDDQLIREGLSSSIDEYPGFCCIGAFSSAEEMLEKVEDLDPHIILMDIGLPGMNGIECLKQVKLILPDLLVVMITVFEDDDRVFDSIVNGADGYLLKKTPVPKIIESLNDLRRGGAPMSNQIARRVLETFRKKTPIDETYILSKREKEILDQLAKGYTYKQISDNLFISPETVRGHLKNIYQKLHVHSKMEAVSKISRLRSYLK
ncbi:MAG: response regulator transcription factor [Ignavibacteriaceae bacterium]|nr:response regulator transcription factor [Ignavibacteriaceae bacterium]